MSPDLALGRYPVKAAAFDTRVHGPAALTGRASEGADRLLRVHGFDVVAQPESFLVTRQDRLYPEESGVTWRRTPSRTPIARLAVGLPRRRRTASGSAKLRQEHGRRDSPMTDGAAEPNLGSRFHPASAGGGLRCMTLS